MGLERRASRVGGSASPLVGRSTGAFPTGDDFGGPYEFEGAGQVDAGGAGLAIDEQDSEFQLFGPAAGVSTQTAEGSQWVRGAMNKESSNFLEFVKAEVGRRLVGEDEDGERGNMMLFRDLLPPREHSRVVAAQAFLHVLVLASRRLVDVRQQEKGDIWVGVSLVDA